MRIDTVQPAIGATTSKKRLGRGIGSGLGKTSGKGHKGQWARSGGGVRVGFEGGQMPLTRRLPKRGFNNNFRKVYSIVNLSAFNNFEAGSVIDKAALLEKGLIKEVKNDAGLKVLASGEINVAVTVKAAKFSESAKEAIEKAGGKAEIE
ncbi:MAG TPA: 50S ribosomal protein L15 [Clostridiales bacterium]|mgnify:CR=1 FL=1|nr:50S ribosomal protein L15 [Clostridia bacterium]HCY51770.1 50S ribosomal protein L15 [Clostridiales bacterium]